MVISRRDGINSPDREERQSGGHTPIPVSPVTVTTDIAPAQDVFGPPRVQHPGIHETHRVVGTRLDETHVLQAVDDARQGGVVEVAVSKLSVRSFVYSFVQSVC